MKPILPCLLLALSLAGCAGSPLRRDPALQDEVAQLRRRVVELQQDARMNEVEIARLRQQVAELETQKTGARPAAPVNAPAPPPPAAPQPTPRPAPPRPAPVAPAPAPEAIEEEDLDVPQAAPSPSPTPAPVRPAAPAPAVAPAVDDAELLSLSAQALYDRGYTLFHQARYVDAEASFQRFLQNNPDSELADNAQYWIGECRYSRNDTRGALTAFREVIEKHPKGNKVPDALLKAGQCLEALGDVEGARVTYREVVRRFPGTVAAGVAEERRAKLP